VGILCAATLGLNHQATSPGSSGSDPKSRKTELRQLHRHTSVTEIPEPNQPLGGFVIVQYVVRRPL
jgi:hypothetical protein